MKLDPVGLSSHFRFGENWQSFAETVDEPRIVEAESGLARLIPASDLAGKRFLDVGCGSGLSMLAALRLGAAEVHGIDLDPASVAAARTLLASHAAGRRWILEQHSILDLDPAAIGQFDVVHSWGVQHHTGAMWRAVAACAGLVRPGGVLVLALYHKTPFCGLWRWEKRLYAHGPRFVQQIIRALYKSAFIARLILTGRSPRAFLAAYHRRRGMSWHHDVHDWLGGYPYESTLPRAVEQHVAACGLRMERVFENCAGTLGLFGTGCDEFIARRDRQWPADAADQAAPCAGEGARAAQNT